MSIPSHVTFVSPLQSPQYISSGDDSPPEKSRKRSRDTQDKLYGKLAFNHKISSLYHDMCAEAYDNQFQMKHGIADMTLLQDILKLVDDRAAEIRSKATAVIPSTPRKRRKPQLLDERKIDTSAPKRSLYRAESPRTDSNPSTPFDLLLQHKDFATPDSPSTPSKKPKIRVRKSPDNLTGTSGLTKSKSAPLTVVVISDDEDDEDVAPNTEVLAAKTKISDLFQLLNDCRRDLSATLALLPQDILPHQTIKQLSEQPPNDYKGFQRIVSETCGIPEANSEERDAYVRKKWKEFGQVFLAICIGFNSNRTKEEEPQPTTSANATAAFRKTVSIHQFTPSDKPKALSKYRFV